LLEEVEILNQVGNAVYQRNSSCACFRIFRNNKVRLGSFEHEILYFYERKRGEFNAKYTTEEIRKKEFGENWKERVISNEKAAQAYLAMFLDMPAQAKSSKKKIFIKDDTGYYNKIFNDTLLEEQLLASYRLLEFVEKQTEKYSESFSRDSLDDAMRTQLYKYDFLLHSDFFILNLLKDFLKNKGFSFDKNGCDGIIAFPDNDAALLESYTAIKELLLEYIDQRKQEDKTY